jgi:NTP pyrophosphatase (non-canonical NTP hydrolase)
VTMKMNGEEHAFDVERNLPRDRRQEMIANWAEMAFGREQTTSIPQRGLRLLEEAIEAFQAAGGDEGIAHKLVEFVFARPVGTVGQELGGVAVTVHLLAAAAGLSADEEECREMHRVLSKPLREFTDRNASKNAAGFLQLVAGKVLPRNPCCPHFGTEFAGGREYCSTCGRAVSQ